MPDKKDHTETAHASDEGTKIVGSDDMQDNVMQTRDDDPLKQLKDSEQGSTSDQSTAKEGAKADDSKPVWSADDNNPGADKDKKKASASTKSASKSSSKSASKSSENSGNKSNTESGWKPKRHNFIVSLLIGLLILIGVCLILYSWDLPPFSFAKENTNNAYVRGDTTLISPKVSGYVEEVLVQDYDNVIEGQPLFKIDDTQYAAKVEQIRAQLDSNIAALNNNDQQKKSAQANAEVARASIASAQAQLQRARADYGRAADLVGDGSISVRERDQSKATLSSSQAQLQQANAQYHKAQQDIISADVNRESLIAAVEGSKANLAAAIDDLNNTVVRAPRDGKLSQVGVKLGQLVSAGTQLTFIVPPVKWVIANYKEHQTNDMHIGQKAYITVDAFNGKRLDGWVSDIAPAAASEFSAVRPDPGTGNFVKVAQRIPVKIMLDTNQEGFDRLAPGMSVEVNVLTDSKADADEQE
ncbi:HlyD family secretion protein [Brackiella oedipodis]|uniref:HlyD family secretion protein n=1 Tax=Brackiella oedipodis TaxID=124225 RepID=UPI000A6E9F5C|nr:HlyD family secretion protein [Brackiella oedipodis]